MNIFNILKRLKDPKDEKRIIQTEPMELSRRSFFFFGAMAGAAVVVKPEDGCITHLPPFSVFSIEKRVYYTPPSDRSFLEFGGLLSLNGGNNTLFDLSAGAGYISDKWKSHTIQRRNHELF